MLYYRSTLHTDQMMESKPSYCVPGVHHMHTTLVFFNILCIPCTLARTHVYVNVCVHGTHTHMVHYDSYIHT